MCNSSYSDYELVQQFESGNHQAIEELIARHKKRIFTYIMLMVKNEQLAEDIFQDTFIKVILSLKEGRYSDKGKFVSWVARIAHNLIIDHFRKEKNLQTVSNDQSEYDLFNSAKLCDQNIEDTMVNDQIVRDIRRMIDELPEDQREVVLLRHYAGMSFKEIADQTNVSINTALGRMRYALINLRKIMAENQINLTLA
ncbi:MAG: sigma-70 family RNA polymerase sigma factor [Bacteroidales bacterium]|nr:sigma-70 family RNA polymerase sigma factor [Bacteroidales bacterium]